MSDGPKSYGPRCGGHSPEHDAYECNRQQAQQQNQINHSGGDGCKVVVPTSSGGVDVNSPDNNTSNAAGLVAVAAQGKANRQFDDVGDYRNAANQPTTGGKKTKKDGKNQKKLPHAEKKELVKNIEEEKFLLDAKGEKDKEVFLKKQKPVGDV